MYFNFTTVDVTPDVAELRILEHAEEAPEQHVRIGISQKLAKQLGFNYRDLPIIEETTTDMRTYYAVTTTENDDKTAVLIRHARDNDPEAVIVAGWEDYLTNGRGEFGPFVFAMFDEWMAQDQGNQRYQLSIAEFTEQSDWPWMFYQAPRTITKQMVLDHRDFKSSVVDDVRKTVQRDLRL